MSYKFINPSEAIELFKQGKRVEYYSEGFWYALSPDTKLSTLFDTKLRILDTVQVSFEYIKPITKKPTKGDTYWFVSLISINGYDSNTWANDDVDNHLFNSGLIYDNPYFAELVGKAIVSTIQLS